MKEEDFKICPNCGGHFKKLSNDHLVCENCNLQYYINPRPCNAIILKKPDGKIVFVKRKHDPHKGLLDLPGGFTNLNETMEESVIREAKEELKITISDFKYIGSVYDTYEYGGILAYTLCSLFEGTVPADAPIIPSDDAEDVLYYLPEEIPLEKIGFKSQHDFLKNYFKR